MQQIIVCWDKTVTAEEGKMIDLAAKSCIEYFPGVSFVTVGRTPWTKDGRTSGETIMSRADHRNGQVNVRSIMREVSKARDADHGNYCVVVFTAEDLNSFGDGLRFCFGARIGDVIVESLCRFRHLSYEDEKLCILRILRHELGHMFGAAANKNANHPKLLYRKHCTNSRCSMRQTLNVQEVLRMAKEEDVHGPFCPECEADIARVLPRSRKRKRKLYFV